MSASRTNTCPSCGQRILWRHGVHLAPRKAEIFDAIEKSGQKGIPRVILASMFYPDWDADRAMKCIKAHVSQINDVLEETHVVIARMFTGVIDEELGRRYRVELRQVREIA